MKTQPMPQQIKKSLVISIYLVLTVSALLVFWQVRNFNFVNYDDGIYVSENPHVLNGLTVDNVIWAFTTGYANFWHPLTWLSYMLDGQLFGSNPAGYHFTNLFLHIANTLLLFLVLKQMTNALWQSAFVAALFALHPLHVESVAWVSERKDVLSAFFWILTIAAYYSYIKRPGVLRYLLTLFVFALGLMSKPMLVTLPFVLLLLDYWPLDRISRLQWKILYNLVVEKIPFMALAAVFSVMAFFAQQSGGALTKFTELSLKFRIYNALISYLEYIEKLFYPGHLAPFYPHPYANVSVLYAVISAAVLLAVTILVIRFAKLHRYLVTGWFWYLGTLVPVIGIIQVGDFAMADRYTYITLTGLFIIIAWLLPELLKKLPHRKIALGFSMVIVLTTLGISAHRQTSFWKDSFTLFSHAIEVTQNNWIAYYNLGAAYDKLGRHTEAIEDFSQAVRSKPNFEEAYNNLGVAFAGLGRWPEAIDAYNQAIKIKPDFAEAYTNLGVAYSALGRWQMAIDAFKQAIRISPNFEDAHYKLGVACLVVGDKNSAIAEYNILKSLNSQLANDLLSQINK
jgi:tetratricopeptide (TPR) repeat protein